MAALIPGDVNDGPRSDLISSGIAERLREGGGGGIGVNYNFNRSEVKDK